MSDLSAAHSTLLAAHYASERNVRALTSLIILRFDLLDPRLVLQIILTYLPESVDPTEYVPLIQLIAGDVQPNSSHDTSLDTSIIKDLSTSQARKRARKLSLLPLAYSSYPANGPSDPTTQFIYHRAHRIEEEAGLLALVPALVSPFLDRSEFLRTWLISTVLPLLRIGYEYYPQSTSTPSLQSFENLDRAEGVNVLMSKAVETKNQIKSDKEALGTAGRDLRGVVGPWMYGDSARKRRKLDVEGKASGSAADRSRRLSSNASPQRQSGVKGGWEYAFQWIVDTAAQNFALVAEAVEDWDGPSDVDFGGYGNEKSYLGEDTEKDLSQKYGQAALASIYAVESSTVETIEEAHRILVRLANSMKFNPPPDLVTVVETLPKLDSRVSSLLSDIPYSALQPDALLHEGHPLTIPNWESYMLLQMFTYSAYQLADYGINISVVNVAKLRLYSTAEEQLSMFRRIMHSFTSGPRKDEQQLQLARSTLIWLWDWGIDPDGAERGAGVFGKIERDTIEEELLKAFVSNSYYDLAIRGFLSGPPSRRNIPKEKLEGVIITSALEAYDNASNGNRTRGGMKKASDTIVAFRSHFQDSSAFKRVDALLAATHAMSFYSLTLQHGVPFQPVNIRVSNDPISLIQKVLEQNPRSYTKLDDLISIAQNFVDAGLIDDRDLDQDNPRPRMTQTELEGKKAEAESRVIGMAVDASLAEDDFETAYSYIANRFQPPDPSRISSSQDSSTEKSAWRAAVAAGKYRSSLLTTNTAILRRLDQRMDLLSRALLLAPPSALPEILNAWRRVEEEMAAQQAREDEAENAWNDKGDRLQNASPLPGTFMDMKTTGMEFGQPTREMGRPTGRRGEEEAPMGLFDVARGAAAAFNRSTFSLRGTRTEAPGRTSVLKSPTEASGTSWGENELGSPTAGSGDEGRVRKRDMAYNAATGALASGLGWVLGESSSRLFGFHTNCVQGRLLWNKSKRVHRRGTDQGAHRNVTFLGSRWSKTANLEGF